LEAVYRPKAVLSLPKQRKLWIAKPIQKQIDKFVLTAGDLHYGSKKVYNAWRQHTDTPEA